MSSVHRLDLHGPAADLCAQAGCRACLNRLVEHHEGLIHLVLRQQHVGHTAYDDLLQEGRIAVWHAILHFDVGRGVAFSSFVWVAIRRQIWLAVAAAVAQLPARLRHVVGEYYGLGGAEPHSLQQIGRAHGLSGERVRQLRNEALVLLRLPALSAGLRELCERDDRLAYQRTLALSRTWQRRRRPHRQEPTRRRQAVR